MFLVCFDFISVLIGWLSTGHPVPQTEGFCGYSMVKNLPAIAGDAGSTTSLGRSPGEGNGNLV